MKKAMIKATAVIVFPIIAALVALSIILFSRTDKCRITLDTESGLSSEHRIKDFKNMVEYIEDNVPFIYDYEELYGISFEDTQEYYYKLISSAEDDFEYYALMQGFINNIPSGHLTLGYPNVNFVNDLYTYARMIIRSSQLSVNIGKICLELNVKSIMMKIILYCRFIIRTESIFAAMMFRQTKNTVEQSWWRSIMCR